MRSKRIGNLDSVVEAPARSRTSTASHTRLTDFDNEDPAARADHLLEVLGELRHSRRPVAERYDTLRRCLGYAAGIRSELGRRLVGLSLPPPPEQISLSRRAADAYRLMSDCFRAIAEDIAAKDSGPLSDADRFAQLCCWGINCLGDYTIIRCECYLKPGPDVWLDIHRLYELALSEGVEQLPVGKPGGPEQTVDGAYKRILLLGLSDPFQHPFRGVRRLYDRLESWASLTHLTRASKPDTRCVFVVDPRLDRPATPALSQTGLRSEYNQKWLVTRDLVTTLKREYDSAISQSAENFQRRESSADELDSIDFLRRMIVRWGIHPVRNGTRRKTYKGCELVVGLKPVCAAMNAFKPLSFEQPDYTAGIRRMIKGTYGREDDAPASDPRVRDDWEIEDESDNGLKLVCRPSGSYGVGVDDLVAVKADAADHWSVGTVHWAQTDESGHVALGVRLLGQSVRPVAIDRLHAGHERAHSEGLLLIDKSGDKLSRSLICPPSLYYPTGTYLVRLPGGPREFVVEATNILLASRSFVWFEVAKPQADSAQKVLDLIRGGG